MLQLTRIINSELLISSLYDQTRNSARNEFPLRSPLFAHYIQPLTRNYYSPCLARARSVFYRDESLKTNVLFLSLPRRAVHRHIENAAYRTKYKRRQRERVWYCYTHTLLLPCYKTMPHGWMTCWLAGWLMEHMHEVMRYILYVHTKWTYCIGRYGCNDTGTTCKYM